MTERGHLARLTAAAVLLAAAFSGLGARLAALHLGPNEAVLRRVAAMRRVEQPMQVRRGRILDRNGQILAMDLTVHDVCVDPMSILKAGYEDFVGRHLARLLQLDPAAVMHRIQRPERRYEMIRSGVSEEEARPIRALQISPRMVWFEPVSRRHYPHGALSCHVIGFTNHEGTGVAGIEQALDETLRGRPGIRISERDGRGRELPERRTVDLRGQDGAEVTLTLDGRLQEIMEAELDRALADTRARAAWAVLQRVRSGEILAMASRPAFDLNAFRSSSEEERRNRAVATVYEPGSTFKVPVLAAVFNERAARADEILDCERGRWIHRGRPLRDYSPHGLLSVADIIRVSSNIGTAKLALRLPEAALEDALRAFGFGRRTGIELPGEQAGIFGGHGAWSGLSQSRIAIGHEIAATALQVLNAVCAVANDGVLMQPALVRRVEDATGRRLFEFEPVVLGRPVRADTAREILRLLARVTEPGGTGARAAVDGYRVAGKTGTAQKAVPGGYAEGLNYASFVGVLPANAPEIGLIVVLDEPRGQRTGGAVAAPVFRAIAEQAVRVLDIPPDAGPEDPAGILRFARPLEPRHDPGTSL